MTATTIDPQVVQTFAYSTSKFPFRLHIQELLGLNDLEHVHERPGAPAEQVVPGKDNHTPWHDKYYAGVRQSALMDDYNRFLSREVVPLFGEDLVVQDNPTFRIHWKGNLSVGAFHRDSDYNHNPAEVNFWIPVTQAFATNTIWIESKRGKKDYQPQELVFGQCLIFPGSELMHGNKVNETGITRVSFDFRVIPASAYHEDKNPKKGWAFGREFKLGDYYRIVKA